MIKYIIRKRDSCGRYVFWNVQRGWVSDALERSYFEYDDRFKECFEPPRGDWEMVPVF